ncbi:MAG: hypothetical protein ACLQU9_07080 [Acidimicrobiales bacterium]|jgi:hypothetical protein
MSITTRIAVAAGIVFLTAVVIVVVLAAHAGLVLVAFVAVAALVAGGNLLYGRHSHGAAAVERVRAAQEAHDRAADAAAEARRAVAEAERRGERYCPLDPAHPRPGAER